MSRKGLLIILDGLGDRPQPEFGGATPLEAAGTPRLDGLAAAGMVGLVDPLHPGIPVDTQTGSGVLLGLAPKQAYALARGPVEAAGVGLALAPGDIALRCNFATLRASEDGLLVEDRRAGRIRRGMELLAADIDGAGLGDGITASFRPATQHRAVLRLAGPDLSDAITDTDPGGAALPATVLPCRPEDPGDAAAARTAEAVNRLTALAHERMRGHPVNREREERGEPPANGLLCRGAGMMTPIDSVVTHLGLSAAVVAGERTVLGLGRLFDYETVTAPGFTSLPDTDIEGKMRAARAALADHDLVYLHVKAPDICSHDRLPGAKRDFLERFDGALESILDGELVIGVAADHSTDSGTGEHVGDPVPALLHAPRNRRDGARSFGETPCLTGGLGRITGRAFLLSFLDAMGAVHNYRASDRRLLD